MTTPAISAQGTLLKIGNGGSPETFATITGIGNLAGPTGQRELIDVTGLDSTGREYLVGIPDYGDITCTLFYAPLNTQHAALFTAFQLAGQTATNFTLTFTDSPATVYSFAALVQGFPHNFNTNAAVEVNLTLKLTGAIVKS
jgi:hypothetical protein